MALTIIALTDGSEISSDMSVDEAANLVAAAKQRGVMVKVHSPRSGRQVAIAPNRSRRFVPSGRNPSPRRLDQARRAPWESNPDAQVAASPLSGVASSDSFEVVAK
jgi:hypothetical protein